MLPRLCSPCGSVGIGPDSWLNSRSRIRSLVRFSYSGRDATRQSIVAKIKELEATQPSNLVRDCASKAVVGEVEHGEEREVTEVRAERSLEGNTRQLHGGHVPPAPAARDANPGVPVVQFLPRTSRGSKSWALKASSAARSELLPLR